MNDTTFTAAVSAAVAALLTFITTLTGQRITSKGKQQDELTAFRKDLIDRIEGLEQKVRDQQAEIGKLQQERAELIERFATERTELKIQIAALNATVTVLQQRLPTS